MKPSKLPYILGTIWGTYTAEKMGLFLQFALHLSVNVRSK